jgi:hypothetical protein
MNVILDKHESCDSFHLLDADPATKTAVFSGMAVNVLATIRMILKAIVARTTGTKININDL